MNDRINLDDYAESCVAESIDTAAALDLDSLRDAAQERVHEEADSACIYTHHCQQIIDDHESGNCVPDKSELGGTYRADQWREAVAAWAYEIAAAVISAKVAEIIGDIETAADDLGAELDHIDGHDDLDPADIRVSTSCPHGWAAHDDETPTGVLRWLSGQVDGLAAIAIKAGPIWLSYTWQPGGGR